MRNTFCKKLVREQENNRLPSCINLVFSDCRPGREPVLGQGAIHTIEHLAATFLRNHPAWAEKIVYWGPMGCLTGNYLLMKGDLSSSDILPLMIETFSFIASYEGEIPGASARDCGNYLLHDLPMARYESDKYLLEVLLMAGEETLKYPL